MKPRRFVGPNPFDDEDHQRQTFTVCGTDADGSAIIHANVPMEEFIKGFNCWADYRWRVDQLGRDNVVDGDHSSIMAKGREASDEDLEGLRTYRAEKSGDDVVDREEE